MTSAAIAGSLPTWIGQYPYPPVVPATGVSVTPNVSSNPNGDRVTVTGTGFMGDGAQSATVAFGAVQADPATTILVDDATITCIAPNQAAGSVDVTITVLSGAPVIMGGFTYRQGIITNFTPIAPATGLAAGGTPVTISGDFFDTYGATSGTILFDSSDGTGGVPATLVVVVNASTITCVTPAHAVGLVDVWMTLDDGRTAAMPASFTYT